MRLVAWYPYATPADLSGRLGQPTVEDAVFAGMMETWIKTELPALAQRFDEWAATMGTLIQQRAATSQMIQIYNRRTVEFWLLLVTIAYKAKQANASFALPWSGDTPPFPVLYAYETRFEPDASSPFGFTIAWRLTDNEWPDFERLKRFGPPAPSMPSAGLGAVQLVPFFAALVASLLVVGAAALYNWSTALKQRALNAREQLGQLQDDRRHDQFEECIAKLPSYDHAGRKRCAEEATLLYPDREPPPPGMSLGGKIVWLGAGAASLVGAYWLFKRVRRGEEDHERADQIVQARAQRAARPRAPRRPSRARRSV